MRVAVFTDNDFDKVNGVTTTLVALGAHAPQDIAVRIYTASTLSTDSPQYLALASRPVPIPFYTEMSMYVPRWREYLRRVVEDRIDVLHVTTPGPLGLTALWIAAKTGLPLIGSFHTDLATYTRVLSGSARLARVMGAYLHWLYGRCRRVLVPSAATRALLVAGGIPDDRLTLWERGVDTDLFSPLRRSAALRERWRVSDDRPALLYVGRVSAEKGLTAVPALLARLERMRVPHRLVVAGDGPLRRWLTERCPDAVFLGTLGREAVADAFASGDLFLFPSRTDTAGNVVLEAQASGVPVLVSPDGGPRENMIDGRTGYVCHGRDLEDWTDRVVVLLRQRTIRHAMGHEARVYALSRRWELALASVFNAYRESLTLPGVVHNAA